MSDRTLAMVGAVGGAGATRLTLEFAATVARTGRTVLVVDTAYATQGLATVTPGQIETDLTAVLAADRSLEAAVTDLSLDVPGRVSVAPVRAPFERFSRAMTSQCAQRLAERISRAAGGFDLVLVDVPPVATNPAVAAVTAADRVALVVPDSQRGVDALARSRERLADVDAGLDAVVANRGDPADPTIADPDAVVPESEVTALSAAPVSVAPDPFPAAVQTAVETVLGVDLDLDEPDPTSLADYLPG